MKKLSRSNHSLSKEQRIVIEIDLSLFFSSNSSTKCSTDEHNDCILQMMTSSSSNVHLSIQFENASDCSQALDHWRISSAESNGFKVYHFIQYRSAFVKLDL
ncbi:hypothetical protein ABG067_002017 [Albugo candida]